VPRRTSVRRPNAEGKAIASRNAHRHGLASRIIVLPEDSRQEFLELLEGFRSEFQPASPFEEFLLLVMAAAG
jgi:hypothetical protein